MERTKIVFLLHKYQHGNLTPAEARELEEWADSDPANHDLMQRVSNEEWLTDALVNYDRILPGNDYSAALRLTKHIRHLSTRKPISLLALRKWVPYAAAVILVFAVVKWHLIETGKHPNITLASADILPGGNKATLTFADGNTIELSEEQNGIISKEGEITYNDGTVLALSIDTLVLATPKGGTYQVTLPDGSKISLNAASTLKYPSRFTGEERRVEFAGEGYFEIEKDIHKPFRVVSNGQQVDVLGTTFNIAVYPDDQEMRTTLIEGSINVSSNTMSGPESIVLVPAEQAVIKNEQLTKRVVDINSEIAWRNGLFAFRHEKLSDIMRKVARWYDVGIVFSDDIGNRTFSGTVSRYAAISEVLETLALTDQVVFEVSRKAVLVKSKK